eukprot:515527-Rhodomonas_salina.2
MTVGVCEYDERESEEVRSDWRCSSQANCPNLGKVCNYCGKVSREALKMLWSQASVWACPQPTCSPVDRLLFPQSHDDAHLRG